MQKCMKPYRAVSHMHNYYINMEIIWMNEIKHHMLENLGNVYKIFVLIF